MSSHTMISAIILAAGSSSRMGRPKQMLEIGNEKLLERTIQAVTSSGVTHTVVVLGANEDIHRGLIQNREVDIVVNPEWQRGMGSSIRVGVCHVASQYPEVDAVMIFVCDQPLLSSSLIKKMIQTRDDSQKPIVACQYGEAVGVPVLFNKKYFKNLRALPDDQGAKGLIVQHTKDVALVPFPGGAIDLDTRDDYENFLRTT